MSLIPPGFRGIAVLALVATSPTMALIIREPNPDTHKRLLNFPERVYHVVPSPNPAFISNASLLLGIGSPDDPEDWTRQMALVSPRHFIYATHYTLNPAWQIIFVGNDGQQHLYGIQSQTPIINTQGEQTDMMLVTLSSPVDTSLGITPFPVLNLPSEADYVGKPILVCGSFVDCGTNTIKGHITLTNDPGFDTTRFIYFDYDQNDPNGHPDDCSFYFGDSGGPIFVMENGHPAIVGTISASDDLTPDDGIDGPAARNYMASIPSYLPQLDATMEATGYHMKRFYPAATMLGTHVTANGPLRQSRPGSIAINTGNFGAAAAHNVNLVLTFPTAPASVSGPGWICEAATPLIWKCRRGGIANAASASLTATWTSLPAAEGMQLTAVQTYDGGSPVTIGTSLSITPSYATWINGVSDPAYDADPDHDGISNLMEYAFGGSPTLASPFSPDGRSLIPRAEKSGNNLLIRYPLRTDATERGLTKTVQFSNNLGEWDSSAPSGAAFRVAPYAPTSDGFEEVTVSVPLTGPMKFVRVKVTLAE